MDEKPSSALRTKRDSSIHVAMQLVRDGAAHAVVSAGNSGAVMAIGKHILKMLPGIDRPAMCAQIPDRHSHCYVLDLGANINSSSEQLYQYAIMGSVIAMAVDKIASPRVGLLNIGEEDIKGNEQIKLAARLLEENNQINYIGYIEADKIYEHAADVVVCDGFVGNTVLKASEGVARLIEDKIKVAFSESLYGKVIGVLALPFLRKFSTQIYPGRLNGESLLGLQGSVIKSHGGADSTSFASAIRMAYAEAYKGVPQLINQQLETMNY
jgi:glycerol-3-phosphate acyltransferase PlsX